MNTENQEEVKEMTAGERLDATIGWFRETGEEYKVSERATYVAEQTKNGASYVADKTMQGLSFVWEKF